MWRDTTQISELAGESENLDGPEQDFFEFSNEKAGDNVFAFRIRLGSCLPGDRNNQ
jgi:hypothetical protein